MDQHQDRLAELRASVADLSDDELRAIIGVSRNNRQPKPKVAKPPKATKAKAAKPTTPTINLDALTPEQAAALIAKLTGGNAS